jgi:hypothetical protein
MCPNNKAKSFMLLNLPIIDYLVNSKNILIAGAGGGNDVYAGLPLYFTLQSTGKSVHLANYTFCDFGICQKVSKPFALLSDRVLGACGEVEITVIASH